MYLQFALRLIEYTNEHKKKNTTEANEKRRCVFFFLIVRYKKDHTFIQRLLFTILSV